MTDASGYRVVEVTDERDDLAREALELLVSAIGDVQPVDDLLSELEERRRGMPNGGVYHLLALVDEAGRPAAAAAGVYLQAVNAGFVTYLAVHRALRGQALGGGLRDELVRCFREDALRVNGRELAFVVGEVRRDSPWLRSLVRRGQAIPFALPYFHPWMPLRAEGRYVLYREIIADTRTELPVAEVVPLLYAIWRRAYRIRSPLQSEVFCHMVDRVESAGIIGPHPDY